MAETNFQMNLRRLLHFEHRSGREAAKALGVSERTVSQWLTGKRYPSGKALAAIDKLYGISPRDLDLEAVEFAQRLADPTRLNYVAIEREKGVIGAQKRVSERRQAERVVPIKRK